MFSVYSNFQNTKNFTIIILKLLLKLIKTKPLKNLKNKKKVNIHVNDWPTSGLFAYIIYLGLILSKEYNVVFYSIDLIYTIHFNHILSINCAV